jgi:ABC-type multidrug transport system fused ATPase/permease subunit
MEEAPPTLLSLNAYLLSLSGKAGRTRIADRLARHRAGRTTVVTTTSPLVLDRADRVAFLQQGRVVAVGDHRTLLRDEPRYRAVVTREVEEVTS